MLSQTHKSEISNRKSEISSVFAYLEKPSMVDYPRHFAAVFFISGCGFTCGFCHNAALMGKKQAGLSLEKLEAACTKFKKDWVNGVVITGGEPTCGNDLVELLRFFKEKFGFAVKLDTNGSNPQRLAECLPLVDYVAMDIKCGLSAYPEFVGFADIGKIQRSIDLIRTEAKDYEFRTTIIETVHTDEQMDEIRNAVKGSKRYAMQAFIPRDELPGEKYRTLPRTTAARLHELKDRMASCADEILLRGA
ncbi:MAG: anaerobic ribonucleoside-triphosphate reductase activating protein [Verrucomicrobia bacterium]|nr:anaerobic ribonucleoside-triphosphate reductase activating protein [Verrucomicrobiota bacterium]